ncbi:MAG: pantetheine-phosphate adenylyltransferase [Clostridiales bacterium]|nr:pantetheine-phosphate adenylyltransferase [Clostridiales bacterium]
MEKKALYAGSFDPITNGHLDIIDRAARQYDKLVIGVIANPSKTPFFSISERIAMIGIATSHLGNVEVAGFEGLLAEYVNENYFDVVVRGLRAITDFEYEIQMAQMNARLFNNNVETVFLMTNPRYSFISSNLIREVHQLGGNINGLVPDKILNMMNQKRGMFTE